MTSCLNTLSKGETKRLTRRMRRVIDGFEKLTKVDLGLCPGCRTALLADVLAYVSNKDDVDPKLVLKLVARGINVNYKGVRVATEITEDKVH